MAVPLAPSLPTGTSALLFKLAEANALNDATTRDDQQDEERPVVVNLDNEAEIKEHAQYARLITLTFEGLFKSLTREQVENGAAVLTNEKEFIAFTSHVPGWLRSLKHRPSIWLGPVNSTTTAAAATNGAANAQVTTPDGPLFGMSLLVLATKAMAMIQTSAILAQQGQTKYALPAQALSLIERIQDVIASTISALALYGSNLNGVGAKDMPGAGLGYAFDAVDTMLSFCESCLDAEQTKYPRNVHMRSKSRAHVNDDVFGEGQSQVVVRSSTHAHAAVLSIVPILVAVSENVQMTKTHQGRMIALLCQAVNQTSDGTSANEVITSLYVRLALDALERLTTDSKQELALQALEFATEVVLADQAHVERCSLAARAAHLVSILPRLGPASERFIYKFVLDHLSKLLQIIHSSAEAQQRRIVALTLLAGFQANHDTDGKAYLSDEDFATVLKAIASIHTTSDDTGRNQLRPVIARILRDPRSNVTSGARSSRKRARDDLQDDADRVEKLASVSLVDRILISGHSLAFSESLKPDSSLSEIVGQILAALSTEQEGADVPVLLKCLSLSLCSPTLDLQKQACEDCDRISTLTHDNKDDKVKQRYLQLPSAQYEQLAIRLRAAFEDSSTPDVKIAAVDAASRLVRHTARLSSNTQSILQDLLSQALAPSSPQTVRRATVRLFTALCEHLQESTQDDRQLDNRVQDLFQMVDPGVTSNAAVCFDFLACVDGALRTAAARGAVEKRCCAVLTSQLGHTNDFVRHTARSMIDRAATLRDMRPYSFFRPHLPWLIPMLTELAGIKIINALPAIFGQTMAAFNALTNAYSVPILVQSNNRRALEGIAANLDMSLGQFLMRSDVVDPVAATTLLHAHMQPDADERSRCFRHLMKMVDPSVTLASIHTTFKVLTISFIAFELGDHDEARVQQAKKALVEFEGHCKTSASPSLTSVLKENAVGIMTFINRVLNESLQLRLRSDRNKAIRSLAKMIQLAGPVLATYSAQINATLLGAIGQDELRETALRALYGFMSESKFRQIGPFVAQTTATIVRLWPTFKAADRQAALELIQYIVHHASDELKGFQRDISDMSDIEELKAAQEALKALQSRWDFRTRIMHLLNRMKGDNVMVVHQAVEELRRLLSGYEKRLRALTKGDTFDQLSGCILQTLFVVTGKEGPDFQAVRETVYRCIGLVGAIDPDRVTMPKQAARFILLHNFDDEAETMHLALHLLKDYLVKSFQGSTDTKQQGALAFVIHSLLAFCGFDESLVQNRPGTEVSRRVRDRWESLGDTVISVCTPLLGAYLSVAYKAETAKSHPIYNSTHEYRDWIRLWVYHLMSKMKQPHVREFFEMFGPVLNMDDTSLAQALLPHAVLHVLISGEDAAPLEACQEVQAVLADQVNPGGHSMSETNRLLAAETVFALMDHLSQWLTQARQLLSTTTKAAKRSSDGNRRAPAPDLAEALKRVDTVFENIPHIMIGQAALNCKAYARSLLNFELHISRHSKKTDASVQECYESLHECYASLDEPDGMEGVSPEILNPSLKQQIREHESTGRWTSAQSCWELKLQKEQDSNDPANHVGLLRCLQSLGHYDSMRIHIAGVLAEHGKDEKWRSALAPFQIEAAMIVGDWQGIEEVLRVSNAAGPSIAFGKVVTAIKTGTGEQITTAFKEARKMAGGPIGATGKESYRRVYEAATYLHMLHDLEYVQQQLLSSRNGVQQRQLDYLGSRLNATSPAFQTRELILNMQRNSLRLLQVNSEKTHIGALWLETSKIARKAGHLQTAYSAALQASERDTPWTFVEEAKLANMTGDLNKAVRIMMHGLTRSKGESTLTLAMQSKSRGSKLARGWLTQTRWQHAAGRLDKNQVVTQYMQASDLSSDWESPFYHLGHFHDSLAVPFERKKGIELDDALLRREKLVEAFSSALAHGTKYLYQALPRMMTIWLEMGDNLDVCKAVKIKTKNANYELEASLGQIYLAFVKINKKVERNIKTLPSYLWLAVLPQMVSRVVHKNETLFRTLEKILLSVISNFPHQAFWGMAAGPKSTVAVRSRRSLNILSKAKERVTDTVMKQKLPAIIDQGLALVDQLLKVCDHPISKGDKLSLRKTFPGLDRLAPISIAIPTLDALTVSLPFDAIHSSEHKPFPETVVTFNKFEDVVRVMSSLQRPRKISVIGSDLQAYSFLCKPKDDLRKDARLMEFNSMINKLLKKDSDSRQRKLKIRTYQVVPLNEECGFIEWVPNVVVIRTILNDYYHARNISTWSNEVKELYDSIRAQTSKAGTVFQKSILPKYPSVFHGWFLDQFPDPAVWLQARMNYSRTCAVMSMIGFVLGLGDRHTENILIDGVTGDIVHVDFNCLFDKGRLLDIPEKVPFRLTHNLIDGMGVTGVEGVYRKSCEVTLRILRTNKDSLMSVLETFLHDPLYEWTSKRKSKSSAADEEGALGREARKSLDPISWKLRGVQVTSDPATKGEKEVSIGEQVERLIREAVSAENLGAMYVGWAPHF